MCPPHSEKLLASVLLSTSAAFGKALPLDVAVPFSPRGKMDDFLDNIATAGYLDENRRRLVGESLLALHNLQ